MIDLALILPDGTELSYGIVPDGFAPQVGEVGWFQRSDLEGKLSPDESGLEGPRWVVLGREWSVRKRSIDPHEVVFLILRLGDSQGEASE